MTVTVYKEDGNYGDPISEVREPNAAQHHNGNTMHVYKEGLFGPYKIIIRNDEVSIHITHTSAQNLINEISYHHDLRMELLRDLYRDDRCKKIWDNWNKRREERGELS